MIRKILIFSLGLFMSCKKNYICECEIKHEVDFSNKDKISYSNDTILFSGKSTKKKALDKCKSNITIDTSINSITTYTYLNCSLK